MSETKNDPVVLALERAIHAFLRTKRRYPVLIATIKEIGRLRRRSDVRPVSHDALIQIIWDSFDMLVIDLYSIRESLTSKRGLFALLKADPQRLWARPSTSPFPEIANLTTKTAVKFVNAITGTTKRATATTVSSMCSRFIAETKPLDADRNRVRAHRYEQEDDTSRFFLALPKLRRQIDLIERYLSKIYLIVTHAQFSMDLAFAGAGGLAPDLADIVVHGSINEAVNYYQPVESSKDNPTPWYWHARETTLRIRPRPSRRDRKVSVLGPTSMTSRSTR